MEDFIASSTVLLDEAIIPSSIENFEDSTMVILDKILFNLSEFTYID